MIVTTSWDDGHPLDNHLADLLNRYDLKGTFYITRNYFDTHLTPDEIVQLSHTHEIGAHTLNHPLLTEIPLEQAREEITGSKIWLQEMIGQEITAFCYPAGKHNPQLQQICRDAGYHSARITTAYHLDTGDNPFAVPTTIHVYPFPLRPLPDVPFPRGMKTRLQPLLRAWQPLMKLGVSPLKFTSWETMALATLEQAAAHDGIWHLWGHSWEIEKFGMWDALERVLAAASRYQPRILTNSELFKEQLDK